MPVLGPFCSFSSQSLSSATLALRALPHEGQMQKMAIGASKQKRRCKLPSLTSTICWNDLISLCYFTSVSSYLSCVHCSDTRCTRAHWPWCVRRGTSVFIAVGPTLYIICSDATGSSPPSTHTHTGVNLLNEILAPLTHVVLLSPFAWKTTVTFHLQICRQPPSTELQRGGRCEWGTDYFGTLCDDRIQWGFIMWTINGMKSKTNWWALAFVVFYFWSQNKIQCEVLFCLLYAKDMDWAFLHWWRI